MKKFLVIFTTVALLTGCSLLGGGPKKLNDGETASQQHFNAATNDMHQVYTDMLLDLIPDFKLPDMYQSLLDLKLSINPPDVGKIDIVLISDSKNDISDPLDMKSDAKITFSLDMIPGQDMAIEDFQGGTFSAELLLKMVKQKLFISLDAIDVDFDMQGAPSALIKGLFVDYLEEWYGGTYDEIEKLFASNGVDMDLSHLKEGINKDDMFEIKKPLEEALAQMHIWKLKNALPTEGDMLRFEVEVDQEALKKGLLALNSAAKDYIVSQSKAPQEVANQIERDFQDSADEIEDVVKLISGAGILGISQTNAEYFTYKGTLTVDNDTLNIDAKWLENEKKVALSPEAENEVAIFEMKDDKFTLNLEDETLISGEHSEERFNLMIYEPPNMKQPVINVDLKKSGGSYSGLMSLPNENVDIVINKFTLAEHNIEIDAVVREDHIELGNIDASYQINELKKVDVSEPDDYKSYEELMEEIQVGIGSLMMGMGAGMVDPSMTDDSMMYDPLSDDPMNFDPMDFEDIDMDTLDDIEDLDLYMDELENADIE